MSDTPTDHGFVWADAPRPTRMSAVAEVLLHATLHLRMLLTPRRLAPAALLLALPVVASAGLARLSLDDAAVIGKFYQLFALRAVALAALGMGVGAIREDAEAGTLPLLMLRPRAEIALPVGRLLAVTLVLSVLGAAMTLACAASLLGTPWSLELPYLARQLTAIAFTSFAYAGIFLAIGAWFKAGTGAGLGYLVMVDLGMASVADAAQALAPSHFAAILVETLAGSQLAPAQPWSLVPGAILGLVLLGAAGCGLASLRLRGDPIV